MIKGADERNKKPDKVLLVLFILLAVHTQHELDRVARELNERPRKTLDYQNPAACFEACVALTS